LRLRPRDAARSRATLAARVMNPEDLSAFAPASELRTDQGLFAPRSLPSTEGSGVDLLIVCAPEHAAIFQELAELKTDLGLPTVVRDLDWIQENYPQGADLAETIRFFLRDAFAKWGLRFVLLAGDVDLIPTRFVRSYFPTPPEDIPAISISPAWTATGTPTATPISARPPSLAQPATRRTSWPTCTSGASRSGTLPAPSSWRTKSRPTR